MCGLAGAVRGIRHEHWSDLDRSGACAGGKQSGLGRKGSKYSIEDYFEIKYVYMDGI